MGLRMILLGAPGSGKGTQARYVAEAYGVPAISTGDIFRRHLQEETDLGRRVQGYLDAGVLAPDDLTCAVVGDRLAQPDCAEGYILDGFPRSLAQAEALTRLLAEQGERLDAVVDLEVPDEEIVARLTARRSCPVCGAVFNLKFNLPKGDPTRCDRQDCPGVLVQRQDDRPETVRERLRVYHETTEPLRDFYQKEGLLEAVSAAGLGPEAVFKKIDSILRGLGAVAVR